MFYSQRYPWMHDLFKKESMFIILKTEAELKGFEPRLKFKPGLKYGWFHFKLYSIFQDLGRRSIETGFLGIWDAAYIH